MDDKIDKLIAIFIEESNEIIEHLETNIITLEDSPNDKSLIDTIFRGVHTLKGNANSFGFSNLGGFVHYFEDLLDNYRDPNHQLSSDVIELIFESYDVIKDVFTLEKDGSKEFPDDYENVLSKIKALLNISNEEDNNQVKNDNQIVVDSKKEFIYHDKFKEDEFIDISKEFENELKTADKNGLFLYNIVMEFDKDLYVRGYNHHLFYKLFDEIGNVIKSFWIIDDEIPTLENFDIDISYIKRISLYLLSNSEINDVEDVFEFIAEDGEVGISIIDYKSHFNNNKPKENNKKIEQKKSVPTTIKVHESAKSIRVESTKIDELFDSIGELVIAQSYIDQNEKIRAINDVEITQYLNMLNKTTRHIQSKVMSLRMVPVRDTFLKMKRVSRDVSKKTGKEVELIISGEETEIDKTMIDGLSEPLVHMIRNSIDHGIENDKNERVKNGKPEIGVVHLSAFHKGSSFIIDIRDDGAGIDTKYILKKAIEKGVADIAIEYSKEEILQFLFAPGFSTAKEVTDISGRGVGLDAVKKSLELIKGKVKIESELGKGTLFRIILPLTLAIIDGMSVKVDDEIFIIPTLSVVESFRPKVGDIQKAQGKGSFIDFRGEVLPILRLSSILEIDEEPLNAEESTLICIEHEKGKFILQVKELVGRQQVVIKSLTKRLSHVKEISGAAILGSGDIALILNTESIGDLLDFERVEDNNI